MCAGAPEMLDEKRPCIRLDIHNSQLHVCKTFMRLLSEFTSDETLRPHKT